MKQSEIRVGSVYRNRGKGTTQRRVVGLSSADVEYQQLLPGGTLWSEKRRLWIDSFATWAGSEVQDMARAEAARAEQERRAASLKQAEAIAAHQKATQEAEECIAQATRDIAMARSRHAAADQAHRERIHAEIVEDLRFPPESCRGDNLVIDISEGRIRHLRIIY